MDLSYVTNLSREENFEIASIMHAMILDELMRCTKWAKSDAVFHGGTSLSIIRNSARFSEDLDFMITEEAEDGLEGAVKKVRDRIAVTLNSHYPGGTLELRGPRGREISNWVFVWSHPSRRGSVQVKAEFLVTKKNFLANYASTHVVPGNGSPVLVRSHVPVPVLVSAWADKIKAIATRPVFKWRDAYDLAFIAHSMVRDNVSDEEKRRAITATAAIYGTTLDQVADGLDHALRSGVFDDVAAFEADMKRWFDKETYDGRLKRNLFEDDLEVAAQEVSHALAMVRPLNTGWTP